MADKYKTTKKTKAYASKTTSSSVVKTYAKGKQVTVYSKEVGEGNVQYGNVSKNGRAFILMSHLKKTGKGGNSSGTGVSRENTDKVKDDTIYGETDKDYDDLIKKYLRAFGSPPRYTQEVDPWYSMGKDTGVGRAMAETFYSDPSILSICPGQVDYLPGFNLKKGRDKLYKAVKSAATGAVGSAMKKDKKIDANGALYSFRSAYADYICVLNLLARCAADYMGIGNVKNVFEGSSLALNKFDYGFITDPPKAKAASGFFDKTLAHITTAVEDAGYLHYIVNSSGVQYTEDIQTTSDQSWLEQQLGGDSELSSAANNIQFLFGGAIGSDMGKDMNKILKEARDSSQLVGSLTTIMKNYLKGGRLVFPKIITGMNYDKSVTCEITFTSIYGDKRSIFRNVILPCLSLLALATPKQMSPNMYTYPYLVRIFQKGVVNMDLAFMNSLEFVKGGSDNVSYSIDGLPTEITARFQITPLYSNLMVTSSKNPFLFMQNNSLMEYLGVMTGIDLKANNFPVKYQLAVNALSNKVSDIPTNIGRGIYDSKIVNEIRKFTTITN